MLLASGLWETEHRRAISLGNPGGILCPVAWFSEKLAWAQDFPRGAPMKGGIAALVDRDHDEAETEYYEAAADPTFVTTEREQRRYRGMLMRRLRRWSIRARDL